ncbi:MAG: cytochrome C oxidase Cbb3, partial [Chitinophagales bacterium]|nr:cytochrome C oxidase Cbb3 [Chitinophagales bacterium]
TAILPMYYVRALGGTLYLVGAVIGVYNLVKTIQQGSFQSEEAAEAPPLSSAYHAHGNEYWHRWIERRPVQMLVLSFIL